MRTVLDPHVCHSSEFGSGCESEAWHVKFWHVLAVPNHFFPETFGDQAFPCWITTACFLSRHSVRHDAKLRRERSPGNGKFGKSANYIVNFVALRAMVNW